MIKEVIYMMLATFCIVLLYKILVPVWVSFANPWTTVSNAVITDPTYEAAQATLGPNIFLAINYTFVGLAIIMIVYLSIVAIKKEGEETYQ